MKLSNNFTLQEMLKSQTASRHGIVNTPNNIHIENMRALAENVLQPVRDHFGMTNINSGFRCLELNRRLGSKDTSQHTSGEAADIECFGTSNMALAQWIRDNLEFDQLILEFWYPDEGDDSGWIHVSYKADGENRNQVLTINRNGVFQGLGEN